MSEDLSTRDLVERYLAQHARRTYRKNGKPTSEYALHVDVLNRHLAQAGLVDLEAEAWTDAHVGQFLDYLVELPGSGKQPDGSPNPISMRTVSKYHQILRGLFRWGSNSARGYVSRDAAMRVLDCPAIKPGQTLARSTVKVPPVADQTIDALVAFCRHHAQSRPTVDLRRRWRLLAVAVQLHRETGMRPGELVRLTAADVVRAPGGQGWRYYPPHKTEHHGERREVFLRDQAKALIDEAVWLNSADDDQGRLIGRCEPNERLFPWRSQRHATQAYTKAIRSAANEAGLSGFTANQLRHTFGDWAVRRNPELARRAMGHKQLATTMNYVADDVGVVGGLWTAPPQNAPQGPDGGSVGDGGAGGAGAAGGGIVAQDAGPQLRLVGT